MRSLTRRFVPILGLFLITSVLSAQDFGWTTIPTNSSTATIKTRGQTLAVQQPDHVLLYSALQRRFTWLPVSSSATVTSQNAHILVEDGTTLHGYSAWTGTVATLPLSASGAIVAGPGSANFIVVAQDGATIHAYSSKLGIWSSLPLTTSNPQVFVDRRCALVYDGVTAFGFSSETGAWVSQSASGALQLDTASGLAWAHSGTQLRYFSAYLGQWATLAVGDTTNHSATATSAFLQEGNQVTAYSAMTGDFASYTAPTSGLTINTSGDVAVVQDGADFACYSSFRGEFATMTLSGATAMPESEFVLLSDGSTTSVYSGILGTYTAPLAGNFSFQTSRQVALAESPSGSFAYSSLFHQWVPTPSFSAASLLQEGIILSDAGGYWGLSCRYPSWVRLDTAPGSSLQLPSPRGSICLINDGDLVHAWSTRMGRFESVVVGPDPIGVQQTRFSGAILENGSSAYGIGVQNGRWDSIALHGPVGASSAGSGVGYIMMTNELAVFSNYGSFNTAALYPEGVGEVLNGGVLDLKQIGAPGSIVQPVVGVAPGDVPTNIGQVLIDLSQPYLLLPQEVIPANGQLDLSIPIPALPDLVGQQYHLQNVVFLPNGFVYLSNSVSPVLL